MKNFEEYFVVNVMLIMFLGVILAEPIAVTWFEGTRYIFRGMAFGNCWILVSFAILMLGVSYFDNKKIEAKRKERES
jgi:hypothetical protein